MIEVEEEWLNAPIVNLNESKQLNKNVKSAPFYPSPLVQRSLMHRSILFHMGEKPSKQ